MKRKFQQMNNGSKFTTNSNGDRSLNSKEMTIEELQKIVNNSDQGGGGGSNILTPFYNNKNGNTSTNKNNLVKKQSKLVRKKVCDEDGKIHSVIDFQKSSIESLQNLLQKLENKQSNREQKRQKTSQDNSDNNSKAKKDISDEKIIELSYDPNYKILNDGSDQENLVSLYRTFNPKFLNELIKINKEYLKIIYQSFKDNNHNVRTMPIVYQNKLWDLQKDLMLEEHKSVETNLFSILFKDSVVVNCLESYFDQAPEQEVAIVGGEQQITEG